jgi:hypothetical protein
MEPNMPDATPKGDDENLPLPCAQALVAGTVALMTAYADPCPKGTPDRAAQRELLARRVVSNLFFLLHHPALGAELRQVMDNAHRRWVGLAQAAATPQPMPKAKADNAATPARALH